MDARSIARARAIFDVVRQYKLDHNGRSGTITVDADRLATLLAWFKIMLDAHVAEN